MIIKDSRYNTPAWNATLWRYMSFEKFLDMLLTKTLYFSNITKLTDQKEATIPNKNFNILEQEYQLKGITKKQGESEFVKFFIDIERRRKSSFVNCWILNPDESYALWKIFLSGGKTGVAIKSTTNYIKKSINVPNLNKLNYEIYFGKIDYTDLIKKEVNISSILTTKSKVYNYENECRLIILKEPEFKDTFSGKTQIINDGLRINIDTNLLIQKIYLSPFGGKMFNKTFHSLIEKLEPSLLSKIKYSTIMDF